MLSMERIKAQQPSLIVNSLVRDTPEQVIVEIEVKKPQLISFFCGAGGLDLGFSQAGFEVIFAADYDRASVASHNANSKNKTARQLDLLTENALNIHKLIFDNDPKAQPVGIIGGPPCQGFSIANTKRSHNDPRNNLAKHYAKLIVDLSDLYPIDFFVFENVAGLLAKQNASVLDGLKKKLSERFELFATCLNAKNFGVPQSRERFFMVGLRKIEGQKQHFEFPEALDHPLRTVREAIYGLPEAMYFRRDLTPEVIPFHPNHWTMRPLSKRFGKDLVSNGRSLIRLDWDKPSRTVAYGHREIHVHPSGLRRLTIYEAMLLQGFPSTYRFCGNLSEQVTQVSNAVPPPLANAIACAVKAVLKRNKNESEEPAL